MRSIPTPTRRGGRFAAALALALLVAAGGAASRTQTANATVKTLATFKTHGTYTWKVPTGVTSVTFTVYGASGGNVTTFVFPGQATLAAGGLGGEAKGTLAVVAGEVFEIVVGGQGGTSTSSANGTAGGFNGGGDGALGTSHGGGGGGGGSDVRLGGRGNGCAASKTCGFMDRLIAAGGGGGGGGGQSNMPNGGKGGGLTGTASADGSAPGGGQELASCPYINTRGQQVCATFGTGGAGDSDNGIGGGGGGGGWFGGFGASGAAGGGGGSGYINALLTGGSFPGGTNQGDGKVIITTTT